MSVFTDEFAWSHRLNTNWSLDRNLNAGLRSNMFAQKELPKTLSSLFQQAAQSQMATSVSLQVELAHQAERFKQESCAILDATGQNTERVVAAIQQMSDYLGGGLCEIRWALERHTKVSVEILRVLLDSLDNMSRQYFEQGIKWYEKSEHELAKDRFKKALEANLTNYFAYQYLGFIAVAQNESDHAIRNFDLAQKIAEDGYHRALALSHLAKCHQATDLGKAVSLAEEATEANPGTAKFWYELGGYSARLSRGSVAIPALKQAIERDWTYFAIAAIDNDFDLVRSDVNRLLDELREQQRKKAQEALDEFKEAISTARSIGVESKLSESIRQVSELDEQFARNNVYEYNSLIPLAAELQSSVLGIAQDYLEERIRDQKEALKNKEAERKKGLQDLQKPIEELKRKQSRIESNWKPWKAGCFSYGVLWFVGAFSAMAIAMQMCPDICASKIVIAFSGQIFPFFIPFLLNRISYLTTVTLPKQRMDDEVREAEQKTVPLMKEAEDQHQKAVAKMARELRRLEQLLEQCKQWRNISANAASEGSAS